MLNGIISEQTVLSSEILVFIVGTFLYIGLSKEIITPNDIFTNFVRLSLVIICLIILTPFYRTVH